MALLFNLLSEGPIISAVRRIFSFGMTHNLAAYGVETAKSGSYLKGKDIHFTLHWHLSEALGPMLKEMNRFGASQGRLSAIRMVMQ